MESSMPLEKEFMTYIATTPHRVTWWGGHQVVVRRQKQKQGESLGQRLIRVCVGKARLGRADILGLACLSNLGRFRATGVISDCLVPGLR